MSNDNELTAGSSGSGNLTEPQGSHLSPVSKPGLPAGFSFMDRGYIKDWRKIEDWQWYRVPHMEHVFLWIIRNCNHKDGQWNGITIKRGQLVTGLFKISEKTGCSIQTVRTCLKRLKSTNEIKVEPTNQYSKITVCNYELYQSRLTQTDQAETDQANKPVTNEQQTDNKPVTTNKKEKNGRMEEKIQGAQGALAIVVEPKAKFPPPQAEVELHAAKIGLPPAEVEKFLAFYESNGWKVGKNQMKSWRGAMTGWKVRWQERNGTNGASRGPRAEMDEILNRQGRDACGCVIWQSDKDKLRYRELKGLPK